MSKATKQGDNIAQYKPIKGATPPDRRAPKLSPGQSVSSSQGSSRGKQGKS